MQRQTYDLEDQYSALTSPDDARMLLLSNYSLSMKTQEQAQ